MLHPAALLDAGECPNITSSALLAPARYTSVSMAWCHSASSVTLVNWCAMDITMFEQFPKDRPELPESFKEVYENHYKSNRQGGTTVSSLSQRMESWMHKKVAEDVSGSAATTKSTLELGAGTLNQFDYEPRNDHYDIVEPFDALYVDSPHLQKVRNVYEDISEIAPDVKYDRITSVAVFEHLLNLPDIVARSALLLNESGQLRTAIPSEGTLLWTLGWKLTTGLDFRFRHGLDYGILMRHEHVNNAREIEEVLNYFFEDLECRCFGISRAISFYRFYSCAKPRTGRCLDYLQLR